MTSLADLRDIHLPPPPYLATVLPEPSPWLLGAALVLLLAAVGGWRWWRRRHRRALGRELAALAAAFGRDGDGGRLTRELNRLLRRHAQARHPEAGVAGLSGEAWLAFLDRHGGGGAFVSGPGAVLAWRPYAAAGEVAADALIALVGQWLEAGQ